MLIQWFPGHMTKALRMMEDNLKLVDSVIYVLDSRAVMASFNPSFEKLTENKTVLYVLNKVDLVEKYDANAWLNKLLAERKAIVTANSANGKCEKIVDCLKALNKEMMDRYAKKGASVSVRAMVIGIPNSGKSTLVNNLCGSKRATVGDRPGVTRGKQWVTLDKGVELLDTPGTLWPSFENQEHAKHLAFIGSINGDVLNGDELALELIDFLKLKYPSRLQERYKLDSLDKNNQVIFEKIAKVRGFILKGGIYDTDRVSGAIIDDFRKQKFGKIMLEKANEY